MSSTLVQVHTKNDVWICKLNVASCNAGVYLLTPVVAILVIESPSRRELTIGLHRQSTMKHCKITPLEAIHVTSKFWKERIDAVRTDALPSMYKQMKETGRWDSLKLKWKPGDPHKPWRCSPYFWSTISLISLISILLLVISSGTFSTHQFCYRMVLSSKFKRDSDIAKWVEAACYVLVSHPDPTLAQLVEEAVTMIRGAQREDGYINTYFSVSFVIWRCRIPDWNLMVGCRARKTLD